DGVGRIECDRQGTATRSGDVGGGRGQARLTPRQERDGGAFAPEAPGDGAPDPAAGAGDHDDFIHPSCLPHNVFMDWFGWGVYGLVATGALTAVMMSAQLAGWTRLDLPFVLGTIVTGDPDRARVAGFFVHLVNGQVFALGYTAAFAAAGRAIWWTGGVLGLVHGMVALG